MKYIHKALISYISEECHHPLSTTTAGDGLQSVARDASSEQFVELFKLVLQATLLSPRQEEFVLKMMASITPNAQHFLKSLIEDTEKQAPENSHQNDSEFSQPGNSIDPELEFEERYGHAMAEIERLEEEKRDYQADMRELQTRIHRLQDNNDVLQQRLIAAEDHSKKLDGFRNGNDGLSVKALEAKIKQQENDFADQEDRNDKLRKKSEAQERKIENLESSVKALNRKNQELRDESDVVKRDRDTFSKKANMADKLRQQLQASGNLQKDHEALKAQLEDCRRQAQNFETTRMEKVGLEVTVEEYKKLVPRIEEDNAELASLKRQFELDNKALHARLNAASKEIKECKATIANLRDKQPPDARIHEGEDLEGEIVNYKESQTEEQTKIATLENRIKELELMNDERSSENTELRSLLGKIDRGRETPAQLATNTVDLSQRSEFPTNAPHPEVVYSSKNNEIPNERSKQLDNAEEKQTEFQSRFWDILSKEMSDRDCRRLYDLFVKLMGQHSNHLAVALPAWREFDEIQDAAKMSAAEIVKLQEKHARLLEFSKNLAHSNEVNTAALKALIDEKSSALRDQPGIAQEIVRIKSSLKNSNSSDKVAEALDRYANLVVDGRKELAERQKVHLERVLPLVEPQKISSSRLSWFSANRSVSKPNSML